MRGAFRLSRRAFFAAAAGSAAAAAAAPGRGALRASITSLAFAPDGSRLAVGLYRQAVLFTYGSWSASARCTQVADSVRALAWSPDSSRIAVGSGLPAVSGQLSVWNPAGGPIIAALPAAKDTIEAVAFSKDGGRLLAGTADNSARYFGALPPAAGKVLEEHNGRVLACAFSPTQQNIFATGAMDRMVKVWDAETGHTIVNLDQSEGGITGLAALANGTDFVGASLDGRLLWWRVEYNKRQKAFVGYIYRATGAHDGGVLGLSASADGARLATVGADGAVRVWTPDGGSVRRFKGTGDALYSVALSADGKLVAAGGQDGLVRIYNVDLKQADTAAAEFAPASLPAEHAPHGATRGKGRP